MINTRRLSSLKSVRKKTERKTTLLCSHACLNVFAYVSTCYSILSPSLSQFLTGFMLICPYQVQRLKSISHIPIHAKFVRAILTDRRMDNATTHYVFQGFQLRNIICLNAYIQGSKFCSNLLIWQSIEMETFQKHFVNISKETKRNPKYIKNIRNMNKKFTT